jgi:hypothetical protein
MQDSSLVVISICAISLICVGLLGGIVFLALRISGQTLRGLLGGDTIPDAIDSMAGVERATPRNRLRTQTLPKTSDLRAQADNLDFDAAVAHYRSNPSAPAAPPIPFNPSGATQTAPSLDEEPQTADRKRRRRGTRDEQEMDDMLGGFMDEGGDDILPF